MENKRIERNFLIALFSVFLLLICSWVYADDSQPVENFDVFSWRSVGPFSFSGRISSFTVPRGQSLTYYVAAGTGGIWKTEDGGTHFEPVFDKCGTMSMGFIAVAPSNPDILYVGTGEAFHARSSAHGNGIWKSTNGGKGWTHIGLEKSYFIPKIAVDSKNPDIVYVAAEGKLYDNEMDCERGLYKTVDGGKTWQRVLDLKDRGVGDFAIDPTNFDVVIAAAYKTYRRTWTYIDRQEGNHFYKSTDGGKTWKKLTNGLPLNMKLGRNGIAISEKNPKVVYVRLDEEVNLGLNLRERGALFMEGRMFTDDYYLNKFNEYKIDPAIKKLVKFEPITAKTERELAEKLNKIIQDRSFQKTIGIDWKAFTEKARKIYKNKEEVLDSIDEIEKVLKKEEKEDYILDINKLIYFLLFTGSEGIEIHDDVVKVIDIGKVQVNPDLKALLKFAPEKIKDEKDLATRANELMKDTGLIEKLGIDLRSFRDKAKKVYEGKKDIIDRINKAEENFKKYDEAGIRNQFENRFILEILYAGALRINEPLKKYGVIYRSEDQGETWTRMTEYKQTGGSEEINPTEAGYYGRIEIDPNDDQTLYIVETTPKVSKDGGKTFKNTPWQGVHKSHVDTRAIWIDPLNSNHILNGNDGGLDETWDGGKHWSQKDTISAQQFYDVSSDNEIPYNVMGGTQDNGCWLGPSQNRNGYGVYPADWTYLPTGDGFFVVRDWWNPEFIYFESQFGASRRMNLKTGESTSLAPRTSAEDRASGKPVQRYQWNSPIVLSPHNPGIVYVCSQFVQMSRSRGERDSWVAISPDLSKNNKERLELSRKTNLQYGVITTFAESPLKPGLYWAGTDDGNLQLSTDGGTTWQNLTANFYDKDGKLKKGIKGTCIPYDRWVTKVEPSRHDLNTCYVTYSGYRTNNEDNSYIFVTRDLGKTWEDLSAGMMNPVNDIEEDPDNADVLYLATDYGVFVTLDKGKSWVKMSTTAPDVLIMDLDIQKRERDLIIGTYGRGIYIADIFPFKEFKKEIFDKDSYLFDIERTIKWNMFEMRGPRFGEFPCVDNPAALATIYYYLKGPAKSVRLVIKDLEGNEISELRGQTDKGIKKISWNLTKRVEQEERPRFGFGRRPSTVEPGVFNVTFFVDDKEVATKKLEVLGDPMLK
jgi:photosystem II stability/assembly factor-like uncharacterized protein